MTNEAEIRTFRSNRGLSPIAQRFGDATVDEIREQLAGLAGNTPLSVLRRVFAWKRATGWEPMPYGGSWQSRDGLTAVDYEPNTRQVRVLRRSNRRESWPWEPTWHHVASVREAVDLLVLLGVLPVEFSSMYAAGRADRAVEVAAA